MVIQEAIESLRDVRSLPANSSGCRGDAGVLFPGLDDLHPEIFRE